jgi:hypothetical protein
MIDKISDVRIRETSLEETTQASESPAQDNITPEAEPIVTATPEYKSGLIAEQQMGGQAQEMLLRNQLDSQIPVQNDTRQPVSFTNHSTPRETPKSAKEIVTDALKHVPEELNRQLGEIGDAWSHPGETLSAAAEEAKRKWDDIKAGR